MPFFAYIRKCVLLIPIFNISYITELQSLAKKLQKQAKKNRKKCIIVSKKWLPLHRFNKQMIVLQI